MKKGWDILVLILLAAVVHGQELEVVLPDTIITLPSIAILEKQLEGRLEKAGRAGALGSQYHLQRITLNSQAGTPLSIRIGIESGNIPPADTIIVLLNGQSVSSQVAHLLASPEPLAGRVLHAAGRPTFRVRQVYFRKEKGYGVLYDLADVSRKTLQALAAWEQEKGQPGRLVGEVNLDLPNFLGPFRYLHIDFRRLAAATETFGLTYAEPKLPWVPLGARFDFYQDLRDTLFVQRDLKVQLTSLPGPEWSVALGVGQRVLTVNERGQAQGLVPYRNQNVNLSLVRNRLDHPVNPTTGTQLAFDLEGGTVAGASIQNHAGLVKGSGHILWVGSLKRFVFAQQFRLTGVAGINYEPQLADFGRFGGSRSVRGYREDQFLSPWGVVSRSELRYRIGLSRLHLFTDMGFIDDNTLASAGVGFLIQGGPNLIQVDFGWSSADDFRTGKVHLRVVNFLTEGRR